MIIYTAALRPVLWSEPEELSAALTKRVVVDCKTYSVFKCNYLVIEDALWIANLIDANLWSIDRSDRSQLLTYMNMLTGQPISVLANLEHYLFSIFPEQPVVATLTEELRVKEIAHSAGSFSDRFYDCCVSRIPQLLFWIYGNAAHNVVDDECCPDCSCCIPDNAWPMSAKLAFIRGNDSVRSQMIENGV